MHESVNLRDEDLALVEALQVAPRAPWGAVADALGVSAATAMRRWQRLADAGIAWVTGTPGVGVWADQCLAYVDVTCSPSAKVAVAEELAGDPHALSVEITAGGSDLLVTVAAADLTTLGRYLLERLDRIAGVTGTRTRIATRLYTEGSGWRLGALSPRGRTVLGPLRPVAAAPAGRPTWLDAVDRDLVVELGRDGRASFAALASTAGVSQATARRHTARLIESGAVLLRTELAAPLAGWPVSVVLSADAPAGQLQEVATSISRIRQVRLCATLAGSPSLIVVAWLRAVEEVHRFELALAKSVPDLTIADRRIVLRTVKRMGRLLAVDGRATGIVPMDVWRDLAA
jgi:DNA-binding Lrp family transcriptional regulator